MNATYDHRQGEKVTWARFRFRGFKLLLLPAILGCHSNTAPTVVRTGYPISIYALASRTDEKLVAVGQADVGTAKSGVILVADRYGTPNETFGTNGGAIFDVPGSTNTKFEFVAVQSDFNTVVAGGTSLVRFTVYGTVDTNFGNQGLVTAPCPITAMLLQSDDKTVVACSDAGKFSVTRYTKTGVLDSTVGGGTGTVTFEFTNVGGSATDNVPTAMVVNGTFLVVAGSASGNKLAVASLKLSDLTLDAGAGRFGANDPGTGQPSGKNYVSTLSSVKHLVALDDNTLRIVGDTYIAYFTPLGKLNTSAGFGVSGVVDTTAVLGGSITCAADQPSANRLWLGRSSPANDGRFTVVEYRTNTGGLESYWGGNGAINPPIGLNVTSSSMLYTLSNGFVMLAVNFESDAGKQTSVLGLNVDGSINDSFKMSSTQGLLGPPAN